MEEKNNLYKNLIRFWSDSSASQIGRKVNLNCLVQPNNHALNALTQFFQNFFSSFAIVDPIQPNPISGSTEPIDNSEINR